MIKIVGTGILFREKNGAVCELIEYYKDIGFAGKKEYVRTNIISIRHSKKGAHAFPVHPNIYNEKIEELKETKKSR